jgi:streptomycin 6-kinase
MASRRLTGRTALLHGDLYRENVVFTVAGTPVFIDPLPMVGDPVFDWAFFVVYHDLTTDPIARLDAVTSISGISAELVVPWCLTLCLDGLLYYREERDPRELRMTEVIGSLIALKVGR